MSKSRSEAASSSKKQPAQRSLSHSIFAQFRQTQLQELKEAFNFIDSNKDGIIDKNDLTATWDALGRIYPDVDLQGMLSEARGPLNFTTFLSIIGEKIGGQDKEDVLKAAFETFDTTDTGKVPAKILRKALQTWGEKLTDEEIEEALKDAPIDSKGNVDILQYVKTISGSKEDDLDWGK